MSSIPLTLNKCEDQFIYFSRVWPRCFFYIFRMTVLLFNDIKSTIYNYVLQKRYITCLLLLLFLLILFNLPILSLFIYFILFYFILFKRFAHRIEKKNQNEFI